MKKEEIVRRLKKFNEVKAIYLFGSAVNGRANALSDVDVCVIGNLNEKEKKEILFGFVDELDISFFEELPIWIQFRVFREGKCLFVRDGKSEKLVKILKFWTLKKYFDFQPIINSMMQRCLNE